MRKLNVTDRQTDRRALQYLPSRAFGAAGDKNILARLKNPGPPWKSNGRSLIGYAEFADSNRRREHVLLFTNTRKKCKVDNNNEAVACLLSEKYIVLK